MRKADPQDALFQIDPHRSQRTHGVEVTTTRHDPVTSKIRRNGLGVPVLRALNSVNVAMGFSAGLAIVLIAIILDRMCRAEKPGARR